MPPTTRKRKLSLEEAPSPESAPAPKKVARPAQKTTRGSKGQQRQDEHSKASSSKKIRASVSEAKREIRGKADELLRLIEDQQKQISYADDGGRLGTESLESKVAAVLPDLTTSQSARETSHRNIYEKAQGCIRSFQRLVSEYEAMNKGDSNIRKPKGIRWEQDSKDLAELNRKSMGISLRTLNGIILTSTCANLLSPPTKFDGDIEKVAWELLEEGRPKTVEDTWGAAAQDLMTAFAGVVKLLPKGN